MEDETLSTRMPAHASRARRLEAWTIQGDLLGSWEHAEVASVLALVSSLPAGEPMRLVAFDAESDQARELLARFRAFADG